MAEQLADLLRRRLAEGAYDVGSAGELSRLVTADLQSVNDDEHLRLKHHADPVSPGAGAATWSPSDAPRVQAFHVTG
ncbi:hypothetical protein [Nonomuraea rubra]|uniref:hypothetical protein n=1 Tax=Nonomuraea rubra TaxID=46180 RepID=UPI0033EF5E27